MKINTQNIKFTHLMVVMLFCSAWSFSQTKKIDSLKVLLKQATQDTSKINILNIIASEYINNYGDSSNYYAQLALKKSILASYPFGIANAYLIIGQYNLTYLNNNKIALLYSIKAQQIFDAILLLKTYTNKTTIKKQLSANYKFIGGVHYQMNDISKSLKAQYKALDIATEINDELSQAKALTNIGVCYSFIGNYSKALEASLKALKIKKAIGVENSLIASSKTNIGTIFSNLKDYKKALVYFLEAIKLLEHDSSSNKKTLATLYVNVGTQYALMKNYSKAHEYFLKSLDVHKIFKIKGNIASLYLNIGALYNRQQLYNKSLSYYFESINNNGNKQELVFSYQGLASCFGKIGKLNNALEYAKKALILSEKNDLLEGIKISEETLSSIYEKLNSPQKALEHYKAYTQAKDSFLNEENIKKITRLEITDEYDRKQLLEKAKQDKAAAIALEEIKKQKIIRNSLAAMFVLILIIGVILTISFRNKTQAQQLLIDKNNEIHQHQIKDLLKKQQIKSIQNIIKGQEMERQRVAAELHDGVGGALAGIKMKLAHMATKVFEGKAELENISENIGNLYQEVRTISHHLTPPQFTNSAFTQVVSDLVKELKASTSISIHLDFLEEEKINQISEDLQVAVYRMIQELLKNSMNYAQCTNIEVIINKYNNELNVIVEDNGIGFDTSKKVTGIGLRNIQSRIKAFGGKFVIDSKIGRGSAFHITIPC
ncbi:MAG: tetratricopeptide repeat protein [Bacteroidota bacterium]